MRRESVAGSDEGRCGDRFTQFLQEHWLGGGSFLMYGFVDYSARHAVDAVFVGKLLEFHRFHHVGGDAGAGVGQVVGQHDSAGAMRTGGGDEDLDVNILFQIVQEVQRILPQLNLIANNCVDSIQRDMNS